MPRSNQPPKVIDPKERLPLIVLLKNAQKVLGRKLTLDRTVRVIKYFAQPGVKVFRVNGEADGAKEKYNLNINFQNVSFSKEKDKKHRYKVPVPGGHVYMEQLHYGKHSVKVWCSCTWFRFACFPADTLIPLLDGKSVPIKDLTGKSEFYVYSYDIENKSKAVGKGKNCRLIEKNQKLIRITLDNGKSIRCTPDHQILLSNDEYIAAEDLKTGDSLKAIYRRVSTVNDGISGYEMYEEDYSWKFTHHMADKYNEINKLNGAKVQRAVDDKSPGWERHHCDEDCRNNRPSNIQRVTRKLHRLLHRLSEEFWERISERMKINNPMYNKKSRKRLSSTRKERIANGSIAISKSLDKMQKIHSDRLMKGEHHWQSEKHSKRVTKSNNDKIKKGIHEFQLMDRVAKAYKDHPKILKLKEWFVNLPNGKNEIPKELCKKFGYAHFWSLKSSLERIIKRDGFNAEVTRGLGSGKGNYVIKHPMNHKVISIEDGGCEDVYCFEVEDYHNFAIDVDEGKDCSSGVFVHNCEWWLKKHNSLFPGRKPEPYERKTPSPPKGLPYVNPEKLPCCCKHLYQLGHYLQDLGVIK